MISEYLFARFIHFVKHRVNCLKNWRNKELYLNGKLHNFETLMYISNMLLFLYLTFILKAIFYHELLIRMLLNYIKNNLCNITFTTDRTKFLEYNSVYVGLLFELISVKLFVFKFYQSFTHYVE